MALLRSPGLVPLALATALAVVAAGCSPSGAASPGPSGATASPGGSGSACATAPQPTDSSGWTPPSSVPTIIPVIASSMQTCGPNRIVVGLLDPQNRSVAAPDRTLDVAFFNLGRDLAAPVSQASGRFVWAIENARGVYVFATSFAEAGVWGAEFITAAPGSDPLKVRLTFDVQPEGITVAVGEKAPATTNPVLADVGGDLARISTDQRPDPRLYQTTVEAALAAGKPFVLAFATPKFCTSAQCGPTLDRLKPFIDRYPGVAFINVEPYKLKGGPAGLEADLDANGQLVPVDTTNRWGLTSEPWLFVVDRTGVVRASFEGVFGDDEMTAALDSVK